MFYYKKLSILVKILQSNSYFYVKCNFEWDFGFWNEGK